MLKTLAAVVLVAVSSTTGAVVDGEPASAEPVIPAEALSEDLTEAGHSNGRLPAELLIEIESSAGCLLEAEAADHWLALEEHAAADGIELVARWCYRNLATQRATYDRNCPLTPVTPVDPEAEADEGGEEPAEVAMVRKCRLPTAKPGNSNHGWGRAVDIKTDGRLLGCAAPEFEWLMANAPHYGWVHPAWAACGEPKEEAWHWEWAGAPIQDDPARVPSPATIKALAPWLDESEWSGLLTLPTDYVGPIWVNPFLRGADAR